jgi:hypothetical protein
MRKIKITQEGLFVNTNAIITGVLIGRQYEVKVNTEEYGIVTLWLKENEFTIID